MPDFSFYFTQRRRRSLPSPRIMVAKGRSVRLGTGTAELGRSAAALSSYLGWSSGRAARPRLQWRRVRDRDGNRQGVGILPLPVGDEAVYVCMQVRLCVCVCLSVCRGYVRVALGYRLRSEPGDKGSSRGLKLKHLLPLC